MPTHSWPTPTGGGGGGVIPLRAPRISKKAGRHPLPPWGRVSKPPKKGLGRDHDDRCYFTVVTTALANQVARGEMTAIDTGLYLWLDRQYLEASHLPINLQVHVFSVGPHVTIHKHIAKVLGTRDQSVFIGGLRLVHKVLQTSGALRSNERVPGSPCPSRHPGHVHVHARTHAHTHAYAHTPPEGTLGYCMCAQVAGSTKRRIGSYKTIDTFLSQD